MLSLGQLYTHNDTNNDDDNDDADNASTNDDNNDTWWKNHDCIGSLACMPNEPKILRNSVIITQFSFWYEPNSHRIFF